MSRQDEFNEIADRLKERVTRLGESRNQLHNEIRRLKGENQIWKLTAVGELEPKWEEYEVKILGNDWMMVTFKMKKETYIGNGWGRLLKENFDLIALRIPCGYEYMMSLVIQSLGENPDQIISIMCCLHNESISVEGEDTLETFGEFANEHTMCNEFSVLIEAKQ